MDKKISEFIKLEEINEEKSGYEDYFNLWHDVIKLRHIPTNIQVTGDSMFGISAAYNIALEKLEKKVCRKKNKSLFR